MAQEFKVPHLVCCLDIVQHAIDHSALSDYIRSNYKKEIVFLNALDFSDSGGRASKADTKGSPKSKNDGPQGIARSLKSRIDSDVAKILDSKKKAFALQEKLKNNPKNQKKGKNQTQVVEEITPQRQPFDGVLDVVHIITNFPYLPKQLELLNECGVDLSAFVAIVPKDGAEVNEELTNSMLESLCSSDKHNSAVDDHHRKGVARTYDNKPIISGQEFESQNNPECYPPLRWLTLKSSAPPNIAFVEVHASDDAAGTVKALEEKFIQIARARDSFTEFYNSKELIDLPIIPNENEKRSLSNFLDYLNERQGDFMNAIYYELKSHDYKTEKVPPPPPIFQQYDDLFNEGKVQLDRKVIFLEPKELNDTFFETTLPPSLYPLLYRLKTFSLKPENALACNALSEFLGSPVHYYAYAGSKFDMIVQSVNKKYQLGLPLSFFDWQSWNYLAEYPQVGDYLIDSIHSADIVETYFDEPLGILWVLALPPIPKNTGQFISRFSMPQTFEGITEYIARLFDKNNQTEKKSRILPNPAQILRDNLDFNILLPNLQQRMEKSQFYYKLPVSISNSSSFITPYFFESGLKVVIHRDLQNEKMTFKYKAYYNQLFEVYATSASISIQPVEGIRIMFEKPFAVTILFNEQSIYYNSDGIIVKSTGDNPLMITADGALIFSEGENSEMIVQPDGSITRRDNEEWHTVDSKGNSFKHVDGCLVPDNQRHSEIVDLNTMTKSLIRPDGVEYFVKPNVMRRILFSGDLSIEQTPLEDDPSICKKVVFDIPNFPVIQKEGDEFSISLDKFEMKFRQRNADISCADYKIKINENHTFVSDSKIEMVLSPDHCEFKENEKILIADDKGIEKICQLSADDPNAASPNKKKKIEVYESHWGFALPIKDVNNEQQLFAYHKKFLPHFYAIRSDMSVSEFIRPDCINFEGCTNYHEIISHPSNVECNIVTYHHPTRLPLIFLINEPMSKQDRANVLKQLHIPKARRGGAKSNRSGKSGPENEEELISNAESYRQALFCDNKLFVQAMNNLLEKNSIRYEDENRLPEPPTPEVLILPPPTPPPRILEMQAGLYASSVNSSNEPLNYWESFEADFAMPLNEPKMLPRPLSPRVALFDPPRDDPKKPKYPFSDSYNIASRYSYDENSEIDVSQHNYNEPATINHLPALNKKNTTRKSSNAVLSRKALVTGKPNSRPVSVKATPEIINFGNVKVNTAATAQIVVTNMGSVPLHYSVTQTQNPNIKVLTIPGVVFPGLKMTLKVSLLPVSEPTDISTSFKLQTKYFEMSIPVTVSIYDESRSE